MAWRPPERLPARSAHWLKSSRPPHRRDQLGLGSAPGLSVAGSRVEYHEAVTAASPAPAFASPYSAQPRAPPTPRASASRIPSMTNAAFAAEVARLAQRLAELGVGRGDTVAVMLPTAARS